MVKFPLIFVLTLSFLCFVRGYDKLPKANRLGEPHRNYVPEEEAPRREKIYSQVNNAQQGYHDKPPVTDHPGEAGKYTVPSYADADSLLIPIRRVDDTVVQCHKNYMTVKFSFSSVFNGYIYPYQRFPNCILFSGHQSNSAELTLYHGACGKKFIQDENDPEFSPIIEHRLMIQWEKEFMCEDDSSVIVRCDKPDDFNKTVAWDFATSNFHSTIESSKHPGPKMWMEIQRGEGPTAPQLDDKPIFVGDVLTLIFTLSDDVFWFDSNILSCRAVDGGGEIDKIEWQGDTTNSKSVTYSGEMSVIEDGCSVKPKLFSHFIKDQVTKNGQLILLYYAHFKAFRFPTSLKIIIQCDVEVCYKSCDSQPSCSTAFEPRAASKARQRREINEKPERVKLENVKLTRTIEVYAAEDGTYREVPLAQDSARSIRTEQIEKLISENCYSSAAFYGWISGLILVFILGFLLCRFKPTMNQKLNYDS